MAAIEGWVWLVSNLRSAGGRGKAGPLRRGETAPGIGRDGDASLPWRNDRSAIIPNASATEGPLPAVLVRPTYVRPDHFDAIRHYCGRLSTWAPPAPRISLRLSAAYGNRGALTHDDRAQNPNAGGRVRKGAHELIARCQIRHNGLTETGRAIRRR